MPGRFHVVCVASTYDTFMGGSLRQDSTTFDVEVVDNVTDIDAIYTMVTPNVYMARQQGDDWILCLPAKQLYNNREMTVNAARQRLNIDLLQRNGTDRRGKAFPAGRTGLILRQGVDHGDAQAIVGADPVHDLIQPKYRVHDERR